jgi:hypothetical protein
MSRLVKSLMNYLRPLIRGWRDSLRGKSFPRRVTAPDGSTRWQNASGRSFGTVEEACEA